MVVIVQSYGLSNQSSLACVSFFALVGLEIIED